MSDQTEKPLEVTCPCCRTQLTLDRKFGEILYQKRPAGKTSSWDDALAAGNRKAAEAEAMFERGMARERNADELLDQKFREALEKADKSDDPPPRIFDLD